MIQLYKGDCLIESDKIESGSVDLILTDLPYGVVKMKEKIGNYTKLNTAEKWDKTIAPLGFIILLYCSHNLSNGIILSHLQAVVP